MTEHPPGWHPDPRGRHEHRYWDGEKWTDNVADQGNLSVDEFDAKEQVAAPIGPSMVNLPAIDPALLGRTAPDAVATPGQAQPAPAQPAQPAAVEPAAPATAATAPLATGRPLSLALLLTIILPGAGHLYLGLQGTRRTVGFVLLGLSVAAVIFSHFEFIVAILLYLVALAYALYDLRAEFAPVAQANASRGPLGVFADLGAPLALRLVLIGGILLVVSLFLPWYRASGGGVTVSVTGFEVLEVIDLILVVVGVAALLVGIAAVADVAQLPRQLLTGLAVAAAGAFVLVVFRELIVPDAGLELDIGRAIGILLADASALTIAAGAAGAAAAGSGRSA